MILLLLLCLLISDLLYLMSSYKSDSLNDESDNDGSDSRSSSTYSFPAFSLCFYYSVIHVSGLGSGVFVPTEVESKFDIFAFVLFVPIGVESKSG